VTAPSKRRSGRSRRSRRSAAPRDGAEPRAGRVRRSRRALPLLVCLVAASVLGVALAVLVWSRSARAGAGQRVRFDVPPDAGAAALAESLAARGLVESAFWFGLYLEYLSPPPAAGPHLLRDDLSPRSLSQRLARSAGRPSAKVTLPEGFHHRQIGERLETLEVCPRDAFERAVFDPALRAELRLKGTSAEGFLFPATYDFAVDADARAVVRVLVGETRKRLARFEAKYGARFDALERDFGFGELEILTLASIVEREAANREELPRVASVFFNRLKDPNFRPIRMLQSDPTAAYGCLVEPALAPSCSGFTGRVTPAMLRDEKNRYNTYRHAGLPPGPIANPGEQAIHAVLEPAQTDFLYFVATGNGRHTFTRSFEEHRGAIDRSNAGRPR
jgi:UPF0755 protein